MRSILKLAHVKKSVVDKAMNMGYMGNRSRRLQTLLFLTTFMVCYALVSSPLLSAMELTSWQNGKDPAAVVNVQSRSGSPLLLEFAVAFPDFPEKPHPFTGFQIHSDSGYSFFAIPSDRQEMEFALTPFTEPGSYSLTLSLVSDADPSGNDRYTKELEIAFADFIWGRDNFRFSNVRSEYWGILPYSNLLFKWAGERFGNLEPAGLTVILDYAYRIFSGSMGRCYAFTGSQVRYRLDPGFLPSYYSTLYDVRETNTTVQTRMNMLQNDIMYDHFVIGGYDMSRQQALAALQEEIDKILKKVASGELVSVGYAAPERHHSLLIYGYISDPVTKQVTLIAANNWGAGHDENRASAAAVQLAVNLDANFTGNRVQWLNPTNRAYSFAEQFFSVEVQESYTFDREFLSDFIAARFRELTDSRTSLIIVEQARDAVLEVEAEVEAVLEVEADVDLQRTGRWEGELFSELEAVDYRRIQNTHLFLVPVNSAFTLSVTALEDQGHGLAETQCSVFVLSPPTEAEVSGEAEGTHAAEVSGEAEATADDAGSISINSPPPPPPMMSRVFADIDFTDTPVFVLKISPDSDNVSSKQDKQEDF
jgi:hypothetical protein